MVPFPVAGLDEFRDHMLGEVRLGFVMADGGGDEHGAFRCRRHPEPVLARFVDGAACHHCEERLFLGGGPLRLVFGEHFCRR
jgi:hypothetical protein